MSETIGNKKEVLKDKIQERQKEKENLKERFNHLNKGPTRFPKAGHILNLFTAMVVLVIYVLIIKSFYFDTEFIKLLFLSGINYIALTFFRVLLILPLPLVIKYLYDSANKLRNPNKPEL